MMRIPGDISRFTKREVDRAFSKARRVYHSPVITILAAPRQADFGRILVITPRKMGNAPTRNRLRRRLKSIFFENELYQKGHDFLVITRKGAGDSTFEQLQELLFDAVKKATSRE